MRSATWSSGGCDEAARNIAAHLANRPDDVRALCLAALIRGPPAGRGRRQSGTRAPGRRARTGWRVGDAAALHRARAAGDHAGAIAAADRAIELGSGQWQTHANRASAATRAEQGGSEGSRRRPARRHDRARPARHEQRARLGEHERPPPRRRAGELRAQPARRSGERRGETGTGVDRRAPVRALASVATPPGSSSAGAGRGAQAAVLLRAAAHRAVWVFGIVVMICAQARPNPLRAAIRRGPAARLEPRRCRSCCSESCCASAPDGPCCRARAPAAAWLRSAERCTSIRRCGSGSHCW